MNDRAAEFASAAEARAHYELEVVRVHRPEANPRLPRRVTRTLRWQALVLVPMTLAVSVFGGVAEAGRLVIGGGAGAGT